jgi:hypothetical protein
MEKQEYRVLCQQHTPYIRTLELPIIPVLQQNKEAVFIEFRVLPHFEFIIRNAIHKLGEGWSHTVVCGKLNFGILNMICKSISPQIRVIQSNFNNLTHNDYSEFLCTFEFWNYFYGEKILIYQEDSCIFKKNISEFLQYDYIGAPYGNIKSKQYVGNGGLSLRSRSCMLEVIHRQPLSTFAIPQFTQDYCDEMRLRYCPEDVYFSINMQTMGIGSVADWDIAHSFSTESLENEDTFGGHQFWKGNKKWKNLIFKHVVRQGNIPVILKHPHRGGWNDVISSLKDHQIITPSGSFTFLDIIEKYFMWEKHHIFTTTWSGIVHYTPNTPSYINCNINTLFTNPNFIASLPTCKFIICLCNYVKNYMVEKLKDIFPHIKVYALRHPVCENVKHFDYSKYIQNKNKKLIQIGQQLRRVSSIYKIHAPHHKKIWLTGNSDMRQMMELMYNDARENNVLINKSVQVQYVIEKEYDELLTENIVFIDLYDSAANNTVLECIVRKTPIILNRTPGVVEYLGEAYPLFYKNIEEIPILLTPPNLLKGIQYMNALTTISAPTFVRQICEIINE